MRTVASLSISVLVAACAGASQGTASPAGEAKASGPSAVVAQRQPSLELSKRLPFASAPDAAVYVDVAGLNKSPTGARVVRHLLGAFSNQVGTAELACMSTLIDGMEELEYAVSTESGVDALVVRLNTNARDGERCARLLVGQSPRVKKLVIEPPFMIYGVPGPAHAPFAQPKLTLAADEYVVGDLVMPEAGHVHGTVAAAADRFRLDASVDGAGVPEATRVVNELRDTIGTDASALVTKTSMAASVVPNVERVLRSGHVEASANQLRFSFELAQPTELHEDLGIAGAIGIFAVRGYLRRAKTAEARNTLNEVASRLKERMEKLPAKERKLVSFPAVPAEIPHGTRAPVTEASWNGWKSIQFYMIDPLYYQYEVRAAPDGKSAEIIARGDLDGNGKTSQYLLHVHLDARQGKLVVAPKLDVKDGEE